MQKDIHLAVPEPSYLREALYISFVPVDIHYQAYAICIGQLVDWEISSSTEKSRSTYGRIKNRHLHFCVPTISGARLPVRLKAWQPKKKSPGGVCLPG